MSKIKEQMGMIHSALQDLDIEAWTEGETPQGQRCLMVTEKQATRATLQCFKRWHWFPVTITFDSTLPKLRKGFVWIATDIPKKVNAQRALNILFGMSVVDCLEEAEEVLTWAKANPEALTNGQACRGAEALRDLLERGAM